MAVELKPGMSEKEWVAFVENEWTTAQSSAPVGKGVTSPRMQYERSKKVLGGEIFYHEDAASGKVEAVPDEDENTFRPRFEIITRYYANELGQLATVPLAPLVRPLDFTPDTLRRKRAQQAVLEYNLAKGRLVKTHIDFFSLLLTAGTAYLMPFYDPYADSGRGMASVAAVNGAEIVPIPRTARTDQHVLGYIRSRIVNKHWLSRFVAEAEELGRATPEIHSSSLEEKEIRQEMVTVRELWLGPCDVAPEGLYLLIGYDKKEGGKILNPPESRILPFAKLPLFRGVYISLSDATVGRSFVDLLIPHAQTLSMLLSHILKTTEKLEKLTLRLFRDDIGLTDVLEKAMEDGWGFYTPPVTPMPEGAQYPVAIDFQPGYVPSEAYQMVQFLLQHINFISGQTEVRQGEAPGRVDAAVGLAQLTQAALVSLTPGYSYIMDAVAQSYEYMMLLNHMHWNEPRKVKVSGVGDLPLSMSVAREDLLPSDDLDIGVTSSSPYAREMKMQSLQMMAQYKIITPEQLHAGLEELGFTPFQHKIDGATDEQKATWENLTIFGDSQVPGRVPEPLFGIEDEGVHERVHRDFLASAETRIMASEAVIAALMEHYNAHSLRGRGAYVANTETDAFVADDKDIQDSIDSQEMELSYEEEDLELEPSE